MRRRCPLLRPQRPCHARRSSEASHGRCRLARLDARGRAAAGGGVLLAEHRAGGVYGPSGSAQMKVAVVHDWLVTYAGAERVLGQMLQVLPDADLFSLIDFMPDDERGFLGGRPVSTSFLQRLPWARTRYRSYLPVMPLAIEQF